MDRRTFLTLALAASAGAALSPRRAAGGPALPGDWVVAAEDAALVKEKLRAGRARGWDTYAPGRLVAAFGYSFAGTPYLANSLDDTGAERLIINLRGLDCVTFVETSLALSRTLCRGGRAVRAFGRELEAIRYRAGLRAGYPSRLHYFEDFLEDNAARGNVRLLSEELGGQLLVKTIDFMTAHRDLYPVLAQDESAFAALRAQEAVLNARPRYFIPAERIPAAAAGIRSGDILGITTSRPGLLVSHTGLALRRADGGVYLLHEPEAGYSATVSELGLAEYVAALTEATGVMVARPLP